MKIQLKTKEPLAVYYEHLFEQFVYINLFDIVLFLLFDIVHRLTSSNGSDLYSVHTVFVCELRWVLLHHQKHQVFYFPKQKNKNKGNEIQFLLLHLSSLEVIYAHL